MINHHQVLRASGWWPSPAPTLLEQSSIFRSQTGADTRALQHTNTCEHPLWDYSRTSDAALHTEIISYMADIHLCHLTEASLFSVIVISAFFPSISACIALKRVVHPKIKIQSLFAQTQCFFHTMKIKGHWNVLVTSILHNILYITQRKKSHTVLQLHEGD